MEEVVSKVLSLSRSILQCEIDGHCKEEAAHSFLKNLITKLNAENPLPSRVMIVWLGVKEPVIGTCRRGTGPFVDMECVATCEIHQ
ncbi:hypothetical protein V6N13_079903 [Hibiscus sabdariffa]|uniref:Uncharacterized protein n=1 Tax=Hibiscus sabdariffa TaxID=183260 RepID=A0ABR2RSX3_9ROSI